MCSTIFAQVRMFRGHDNPQKLPQLKPLIQVNRLELMVSALLPERVSTVVILVTLDFLMSCR